MLKRIAAFGVLVSLAVAGWAFWYEPASLSQHTYPVELNGWPAACDGLRIVVLADLHVGSPFITVRKLAAVVDAANRQNPDLVLLAGDYVIHGVVGGELVPPEPIAHELAKLTANLGVFAVLGNHDWWYDAARVTHALQQNGIPTLEDTSIKIQRDACRFYLVGISDFWEGRHDVAKAFADVPLDAPTIAVTHNPDVFDEIPARVALLVAGHTHGGQVNLPFIGRPVVPSKFGQRFAAGLIDESGKKMFVNPGIGTSILPVRFRVPPEISVVVLRSGQ